jgi:hypothetical protein
MASSDLRRRTSAHGTGRPTFIGPWQIGPAPGGEGRARTTPLTAHVGQTSVSPTRGRLPGSINSVVTGRPWASAGSSCFIAGTPLLRVVVQRHGEPETRVNTYVDKLRSDRRCLAAKLTSARAPSEPAAVRPIRIPPVPHSMCNRPFATRPSAARSKRSYRNNAGEEARVVRVGAAARRPANASAGNRPRRPGSSRPGQPG